MAEKKKKAKETKSVAWLLRWGVSCLLIIWAFILGIMVGQGTLASDQQLENLKRLSYSWFGISFYKDDSSGQPDPLLNPDLSFYDELNTRPGGTGGSATGTTTASNAGAPTTTTPPTATTTTTASTPTQPTTTQTPPPITTPGHSGGTAATGSYSSAAIPSGRFTVQVGSFKEERPANELVLRLRRAGFVAYISSINIDGVGLRLRVRVGGFDNLEQAQEVATSLRAKENLAAYVTRNE